MKKNQINETNIKEGEIKNEGNNIEKQDENNN